MDDAETSISSVVLVGIIKGKGESINGGSVWAWREPVDGDETEGGGGEGEDDA